MDDLSCRACALKMIFAASLILFATHDVAAQQEVAPEHFDGSEAKTQMVRPVKAKRPVATRKSDHRKRQSVSKERASSGAAGK